MEEEAWMLRVAQTPCILLHLTNTLLRRGNILEMGETQNTSKLSQSFQQPEAALSENVSRKCLHIFHLYVSPIDGMSVIPSGGKKMRLASLCWNLKKKKRKKSIPLPLPNSPSLYHLLITLKWAPTGDVSTVALN